MPKTQETKRVRHERRVFIGVRIPREQVEWIDRLAEEHHRSRSGMVRILFERVRVGMVSA